MTDGFPSLRHPILVGCCGWPEARARYFAQFPVVELQDTFYQPPSPELASKWRQAAPEPFLFTMKAWQLITHRASSPTYRKLKEPIAAREACGFFRATPEVRAAWQRTLAVARAVRAAVIVFQCPASFIPSGENIANLERFFRGIEREGRLTVWEPRGDWPPATVRELCEALDLVHCVDPFQANPVYGRQVYFRLHGRGGYRYRYTEEDLRRLKRTVEQHAAERPVFVMFNNTYMQDDARRFQALLREVSASLHDAGPA